MSQNGPVLGFSLRDTLTRIIPGLLFLAPLLVGVALFVPSLLPKRSVFYILLGLCAYLVGEFIDQIRSGLFRVPNNFRYFVYKETNQLGKMSRWYIWIISLQKKLPNKIKIYEDRIEDERLINNLDLDFREDIESELGVDFAEDRPREIYDLLLIYMSEHFTPRLRRLQSVSMFSTNLRIAAGGALVIYSLYALANWRDPFFWSIWGISIVISFLVIAFWSLLTMTHYQYDELLMKEYYVKRLQDKRD